MISGTGDVTKPIRNEIIIGDTSAIEFNGDGDTLVGGIITHDGWKLLLGAHNKNYEISQDVMTGPNYPNSSAPLIYIPELIMKKCGNKVENGCLFNVLSDPGESNNLATQNPDIFNSLLERIDTHQSTVYSPDRGKKSKKACSVAKDNGMWWGPFM